MDHYLSRSPFRNLVAGVDKMVPLINGRLVTAINFDNAATTPPLISVMKEINDFSQWYSSIHRGSGYKSQVSSQVYDDSREIVGGFVGADNEKDTVIYVKNTTEAINKLSYRLLDNDEKNIVLTTNMEHHSNDLPWRNKYNVEYAETDEYGRLILDDLEEKLYKYDGKVKLVTVTGISNVTGYINPIYKIAQLAHTYNAKILVDGAQLVPHIPMDMKPHDHIEHIDFLAFSAHKMYAPFGIGVLIGPKEVFEKGNPEIVGGGTVDVVSRNFVLWDDPPAKEEAGTPNLMGVVGLTAAIKTLKKIGMKSVEYYETQLLYYALNKLKELSGIHIYSSTEISEKRAGIIPFNINGMSYETVAKILSYEAGIAVRSGCFCAQPYMQSLLGIKQDTEEKMVKTIEELNPGMVRVSFGLYNDYSEIDKLINSLAIIVKYKDYYNQRY